MVRSGELDTHDEPQQWRGVVAATPGLYFVGLHFLYALSSTMIHGVGRDAAYVLEALAQRALEHRANAPAALLHAS